MLGTLEKTGSEAYSQDLRTRGKAYREVTPSDEKINSKPLTNNSNKKIIKESREKRKLEKDIHCRNQSVVWCAH